MQGSRYSTWGLAGVVSAAILAATVGAGRAPVAQRTSQPINYALFNRLLPKYTKHVTLTWWTWQADTAPIVSGFEKLYPTIKIKTVTFGGGTTLFPKLTTAIKSRSGAPDVVMIGESALPQFVETGGLLPLGRYGASPFARFFPSWIWGQCRFNGKLYAIPDDGDALGLFYLPTLMQKYHLALPTTWAQFAREAIALHRAHAHVYLTYFNPTGGVINGLLWQAGFRPFQDTPKGWKINFVTLNAIKVLTYWIQLARSGAAPMLTSSTQINHDLGNGQFLTYVGPPWTPRYIFASAIGVQKTKQWRAGLIPQWNPAHPSDGNEGGTTMSVTTQTKHPRAATLWAVYDNLAKTSIESVDGGGITSSYLGPHTPGFFGPNPYLAGQPDLKVFYKLDQEVNTRYQYSPWTSYADSEEAVQFEDAAAGKETVRQALENVQTAVVALAKTSGLPLAGR